jgi:UPF0716 protein FxsA
MRLFLGALALMVVGTVLEITLLVWAGHSFGVAPVLLALLVAAVLGVLLLRREGGHAFRAWRATSAAGRPPALETAEGALVLAGSLLLVVPGFASDVLGLALMVRPLRRAVAGVAVRRFVRELPPEVGNLLVGPRRVRSRRVRSRGDDARTGTDEPRFAGAQAGPGRVPGEPMVIEGTIVSPPADR